jgi:sterol 3beta-glucosyltransferase
MILPIKDILSIEKSKAQIGHYGLIVIIKGHEELFFEFRLEDRRDAFHDLLQRQIEDVRRRLAEGTSLTLSPSQRDALILEEFELRSSAAAADTNGNGGAASGDEPRPSLSESMSDSLPAVMFTSHSSTFLTFKPDKPLRFTFLTIGSRGDVQPYIALGKGLMADGHRVKIATHLEFKDWVESVCAFLTCLFRMLFWARRY